MSTYCISDIHGCASTFFDMLDLISLGKDDDLYVLGDIIDKGPQSAEMLMWATTEAGNNIHFLLGNHEDMAYQVLSRNPKDMKCFRFGDDWLNNCGAYTVEELRQKTDADWRQDVLLPWLENLKPYEIIDVNSKKIALVHAGFDPYLYHTGSEAEPMVIEKESLLNEDIGYGIGLQYKENMIWIRDLWLKSGDCPLETVYGHTCFNEKAVELYKQENIDDNARGGGGRIFHARNRHGIDCGCANVNHPTCHALGCLRLDDMEEFYLKGQDYDLYEIKTKQVLKSAWDSRERFRSRIGKSVSKKD